MKAQLNRCCVKIVAVAFAVALLPACVLANTTNSLSATVQEELEKQPVARLAFSSAEHLSDAIFEIGSEQFRLAFEGLFDKFFSRLTSSGPLDFTLTRVRNLTSRNFWYAYRLPTQRISRRHCPSTDSNSRNRCGAPC